MISNKGKSKVVKRPRKDALARKQQVIPKRSSDAIRTVIKKWPDTIAMMGSLLEEVGYYGGKESDDEFEESGNKTGEKSAAGAQELQAEGSGDDIIPGVDAPVSGASDAEFGGGVDQSGLASGLPVPA